MKTIFEASKDYANVRPLSENEVKGMFQLLLLEQGQDIITQPVPAADLLSSCEKFAGNKQLAFITDVLVRRIVNQPIEVVPALVFWLSDLSDGRPGTAVMWAYALKEQTKKEGKAITLSRWCELCPMGPPTEGAMSKLWDMQKGWAMEKTFDNWLDTPEAWA